MALDDFIWDETVEGSLIESTVSTKEKDLLSTEEDILTEKQATLTKEEQESLEEEELIKNNLFSEGSDDVILFNEKPEDSSKSKKVETAEVEEEDEEEDKTPTTTDSNLAVNQNSNKATLELLVEQGLIEFEDDEEFEGDLDEDTSKDLLKLGIDNKVNATIKTMMADLDDTNKEAVAFLLKGGDLNTLVGMYSSPTVTGIKADMDLESEENQILLAKNKLQSMGEEDEDIETFIQSLKDTNKLSKYAQKAFGEWEIENKETIAQENKAREEQKKKLIKENAEYRKKIQSVVTANEEVNGYKLSTSDTKSMVEYLTNPTQQLGDKRTVTSFQKDFMEAMKDPKKQVIIASLIKNGFNFSSIAKKQASKTTKNIKDEIQRQKENNIGKSSGSSHKPTGRLLDLLS